MSASSLTVKMALSSLYGVIGRAQQQGVLMLPPGVTLRYYSVVVDVQRNTERKARREKRRRRRCVERGQCWGKQDHFHCDLPNEHTGNHYDARLNVEFVQPTRRELKRQAHAAKKDLIKLQAELDE